jgi:hypothetical protein
MVAEGNVVLMVTNCGAAYLPPPGLKVGAPTCGRLTVYVAETSPFADCPLTTVIALIVSVALTRMGYEYTEDLFVG